MKLVKLMVVLSDSKLEVKEIWNREIQKESDKRFTFVKPGYPAWTDKDAIGVIKKLNDNPLGFISLEVICREEDKDNATTLLKGELKYIVSEMEKAIKLKKAALK